MFSSIGSVARFFIYLLIVILAKLVMYSLSGDPYRNFDMSAAVVSCVLIGGFLAFVLPIILNTVRSSKKRNGR